MQARRKTAIRLSEDVRDGFARVAAKGSFNKPAYAGPDESAPSLMGKAPGTPEKRDIPPDHEFDKKAVKPIVKTLWAMSIALGHALTAHRSFSRLKSSSFSPDGLLGGRGYVMPVKDVRSNLFEACEQLSALCDTLHDEINAPHWKPKIAELEKSDMAEVEKLLGDAEDWIEHPEEEVDEEESGVEKKPWTKAQKKRFEKEHEFGSEMPSGGDAEAQSQGPHPAGRDHPNNKKMKQAALNLEGGVSLEVGYDYGRTAARSWDPSVLGISPEQMADMDEDERREALADALNRIVDMSVAVAGAFENYMLPAERRALLAAGNSVKGLARRSMTANSTLAPQTEPGGPRVQHLDRGDTDQTGPGGSYNNGEEPVSDDWGESGGVSGQPMSQNTGDSYAYPSDWSGDLSGKSAGKGDWPGAINLPPQEPAHYSPREPDMSEIRGIVHMLKQGVPPEKVLNSYGARKYKLTQNDLNEYLLMDHRGLLKSAASGMPDSNTDSTPTQGWDFGIGDGNGNDAHGQGAGGYGQGNPGSPGDSGNQGVYGPGAELPNDPGGKMHDNEESDTTPTVERSVSESGHMGLPMNASLAHADDLRALGRQADEPWAEPTGGLPVTARLLTRADVGVLGPHEGTAVLPNDEDDPVARSDYYVGPKGNDFNGDVRGQAQLPGGNMPQTQAPTKARPSHLYEHEFAAAGELPGDGSSDTYDYGKDFGPNLGDRVEHADQPYVKWDDNTHNMRPDYIYQRDPIQGPYPQQGK